MLEPKDFVHMLEYDRTLPDGQDERFNGYGVMGVPFTSGDLLALRRFPNTSIGEGYTSVWHRRPDGRWIFVQDAPPRYACSRYFGSAVDWVLEQEIRIEWDGPRRFTVHVDGDYPIQWEVSLGSGAGSRAMNMAAEWIPERWWRNRRLLDAFGKAGGLLMGSGRIKLTGTVPNGQRFTSNPKITWPVASSRASICGRQLGPTGPLPVQAHLADVWLPQNGRFFAGNVYMEPFDPARHSSALSRSTDNIGENLCWA
jgi:hypothetical protein